MNPRRLERQRERIRFLLDAEPTRAARSIAREVGCSASTVIRQREWYVLEDPQSKTAKAIHAGMANLREPAGPGNTRALVHGADSEVALRPLRARLQASLRDEFGAVIDARRLWLLADLLARIESARSWLDERGGVVRDRHGDVFPVVDRLERWGARADALLRELHAALTPTAEQALAATLAEGRAAWQRHEAEEATDAAA
jgi:hypothetical protein